VWFRVTSERSFCSRDEDLNSTDDDEDEEAMSEWSRESRRSRKVLDINESGDDVGAALLCEGRADVGEDASTSVAGVVDAETLKAFRYQLALLEKAEANISRPNDPDNER